jgi:hypothetical protein
MKTLKREVECPAWNVPVNKSEKLV